jgi:hypothetical protein
MNQFPYNEHQYPNNPYQHAHHHLVPNYNQNNYQNRVNMQPMHPYMPPLNNSSNIPNIPSIGGNYVPNNRNFQNVNQPNVNNIHRPINQLNMRPANIPFSNPQAGSLINSQQKH